MNWVVESDNPSGISALRREIIGYLRRHADDDAGLDDCELVVSELISNGAEHTSGLVWVTIDWSAAQPTIRVADVGPGFDMHIETPSPDSVGGRGLFIVNSIVTRLESHRRLAGGTVVTAILPAIRTPSVSIDPPRRRTTVLPSLDEAEPGRGFGREAFLRALVVQLAHTVAEHEGPDAAERAVAQVGADVGGQMELEYRSATGATGPLEPDRLAECFVRLKHAIDGGFFIVEIDDNVIVLENDRCPFGDAVRLAPSLCRMTSSVFGGIAARSARRDATVRLEERIAIGDPRCRVVIELDPRIRAGEQSQGHRYRTPTTPDHPRLRHEHQG
jgi:anti-sigma regulatory factor (Ser/Thr protein kinase)